MVADLPTVDPEAPLTFENDSSAPLLDVRDLSVEFTSEDGIVHAVDRATGAELTRMRDPRSDGARASPGKPP